MRWSLLPLVALASEAIVAAAAPTSTSAALVPLSTACGTIVNDPDSYVFNASLAYECLTSVPFNAAVATRFLNYMNDTLQFQSTLAYLKNPPSSYQQPGVDLLGGLQTLQQGIDTGVFPNQYEFEAALQTLLYATHDAHVNLEAGVLAAFSFASPYELVTVSIDGLQIPKVYLANDVADSSAFTSFQPSAIASIDGQEVVTFLKKFAAKNSFGTVEANADWNQLMSSPALDIQSAYDVFVGGATFYPGDIMTIVFENGTSITDKYLAVYEYPYATGPLQTGGDFYNFFVLGFYPASYVPDDNSTSGNTTPTASSSTSSSTASSTTSAPAQPTLSSWYNPAYPLYPDVAQPDLAPYGGGFVSGYFLNATSLAVLSIPSFDEYGDALSTFHSTIALFLAQSRAAGLTKVVIDLQQNTGGQVLLAVDTFKQFFPNIDPFGGARMRAHYSAYVMGNVITEYYGLINSSDPNYDILTASEWVATDKISANTNQNFTSWDEFYGPYTYNSDNFTTTQRYNFSSELFDSEATDSSVNFTVYGYGPEPATSLTPPYAASDIVILSDGICDSSCALFMEMMHHEAGVNVVAVGGIPSTGPMQAPAGSRGARSYTTDDLDAYIDFAQQILELGNSTLVDFLPNRTEALDVYVTYAGINLLDQIRPNGTVPLQFAYEAADCRVFFTPATIFNFTALWQYAADAIWKNPALCVSNSTGFATMGTNTTDLVGPSSSVPGSYANLIAHLSAINQSSIAYLTASNDGIQDKSPVPRNRDVGTCTGPSSCAAGFVCKSARGCKGGQLTVVPQCLKKCTTGDTTCGASAIVTCQPLNPTNAVSPPGLPGFCPPPKQSCGNPSKIGPIRVGGRPK